MAGHPDDTQAQKATLILTVAGDKKRGCKAALFVSVIVKFCAYLCFE